MNFQSNPTILTILHKDYQYSIISLWLQIEDVQISISLMKILVNWK